MLIDPAAQARGTPACSTSAGTPAGSTSADRPVAASMKRSGGSRDEWLTGHHIDWGSPVPA
jgi:hypothetical protein